MTFKNSLQNFDKLEKELATLTVVYERVRASNKHWATMAEELNEQNVELKAREEALCLAYEALQKEKDDLQTALETIVYATLAKEGAL